MTERTGPSNSVSCAYFAPQQVGWATSKSFQIPSILVKDNMLRTSQIFHKNPNHAYSYRVDCGNYHIAESSPEPLSMARVLQILSQSKSGITTAHPFFTLSFGEVALFQFAESKPVTSRAANPWIPNVEHPSKLLLAVRSGASAVVRYPWPTSFALSQQVTKDFLWQAVRTKRTSLSASPITEAHTQGNNRTERHRQHAPELVSPGYWRMVDTELVMGV